jgi:hypothetical protein
VATEHATWRSMEGTGRFPRLAPDEYGEIEYGGLPVN